MRRAEPGDCGTPGRAWPADPKEGKPQAASKKTCARRVRNKIGLAGALSQFLKYAAMVTASEAMEGGLTAGCKTKSKVFGQVVSRTLLQDKRFKNVGGGGSSLKA